MNRWRTGIALRASVVALLATGAGAQAVLDDLIEDLGSGYTATYHTAQGELVALGARAFPRLSKLVRTGNSTLASRAAETLVMLAVPKVQVGDLLLTVVGDITRPEDVRVALAAPLARCMTIEPKVLKTVMTRLRVGTGTGLREMVAAVARLREREPTRLELDRMKFTTAAHPDHPRYTPPSFPPELGTVLRFPSEAVALFAVAEIVRMKTRLGAGKLLGSALQHRSPRVLGAAVAGLTELNDADYRARVEALASNRDPELARSCALYLRVIELTRTALTGNVLIVDYTLGEVSEYEGSGRALYHAGKFPGVRDAEKLANGNLLVTASLIGQVREIDPSDGSKVVWKFGGLRRPNDADRLADGNTLIADTAGGRVIEVDRKGTIVWTYRCSRPVDADRLPDGNTLIADVGVKCVLEVDRSGMIRWSHNAPDVQDADRLPNGNTLITLRTMKQVCDVDRTGKVVARLTLKTPPWDADRLANGCTLVTEKAWVRVYMPGGRILWQRRSRSPIAASIVAKGGR